MKKHSTKNLFLCLFIIAMITMLVACGSSSSSSGASTAPPAATSPAPAATSSAPAATSSAPAATSSAPAAASKKEYTGPPMKVRIANCEPISGPGSRSHETSEVSLQLAEKHIKEDKFLNPAYEIEIIRPFIDDGNVTDLAVTAANFAINLEPNVIISHWQTPMCIITAPIYEEAGIPNFSCVSGPNVSKLGLKYQHQATLTDTDAAVALADYLVDVRKVSNVLIAALNDEGGITGADAIADRLIERGVKMTPNHRMLFEATDNNFTAFALRAKELNVDAVIAYQITPAARALALYEQIEQYHKKVVFAGSTAFAGATMADIWPLEKLDGVVYHDAFVNDPDIKDPRQIRFANEYKALEGKLWGTVTKDGSIGLWPGGGQARKYDIIWTVAHALNLLAENEGYLNPLDDNFNERLNYWISQVDYQGMQGNINYKAFGDGRCLAKARIAQWGKDGRVRIVHEAEVPIIPYW